MTRTNTNWKIVDIFKDRANKINCKEHFSPRKFDLMIEKIAWVRKTNNCKYNINYHFTWIPKTRIKILVKPFDDDVKSSLLSTCKVYNWDPLARQVMPDHVHFFVSAPPKWAPAKIIKELKGNSSTYLRDKYSIIRQMRSSPDFWAPGYYVGSAGHVSAETIARYITEQNKRLQDKWHLFDLKPFEYDILKTPDQTTLDAFGIVGF